MIRLILPAFVVAALASGCQILDSPDPEANGYVGDTGTIRVVPEAERGARVSLRGKDLRGVPLSVPRGEGRATVINVWWSGCAECRAEATILRNASQDPSLAADFAGINIRESGLPQALRFEERFGITYPSFYDPGGRLLLELHRSVPYSAIPTTIVLDEAGRVGAVILGAIPSSRTLHDVVDSVLAASTSDAEVPRRTGAAPRADHV